MDPRVGLPLIALALALIAFPATDAMACGACYASQSESQSTVVTDHRMAISISKERTILWDQIRYSGNPTEFAYVLPAKPGSKLEASSESWFAALDASTRAIIMAPPPSQLGGTAYDDDDDDIGCDCSQETIVPASGASGPTTDPRPKVDVVEQAVVGPYETVTIRSTDPEALSTWLVDHGFAVPYTSRPIIASYVELGFDFIALRLAPTSSNSTGVVPRAIEPIRIVSPGVDLTLPLRLMQIGAGPRVGITLFVIGEGRYQTQSFPMAPVDFTKLIWDYRFNRSSYEEELQRSMASAGGRSFVTEYAKQPNVVAVGALPPGILGNPPLGDAYRTACFARPPADPIADDAAQGQWTSASCDDLAVAIEGLAPRDVWLTRLRANLPNVALADALILQPAPEQAPLDNVHQTYTSGFATTTASIAASRVRRRQGAFAIVALTALAISRMVRRRRR